LNANWPMCLFSSGESRNAITWSRFFGFSVSWCFVFICYEMLHNATQRQAKVTHNPKVLRTVTLDN